MRISGRGRIVVWEGASLWLLTTDRVVAGTDRHAHHAIQITISLEGGFVIGTESGSSAGPATIVAADTHHDFNASGAVAFLFVEPESPAGRSISARLLGAAPLAEIDPAPLGKALSRLRACLSSDETTADLAAIGRDMLAIVGHTGPGSPPDPRVVAMIAFIRAHLDGAISLNAAAASACLSPSRARHLFATETGLPFKAYVLWQRIERAVARYAAGNSLTEAAHEAGFADSAHLSRTFRKTFGIPASALEVR